MGPTQWFLPILVFVGAVGASVWAALTYAPSGTDQVAALLVFAAGAAGLTWKGIEGTLGKVLGQAETALWNAEVTAGIAMAATTSPPKKPSKEQSRLDAQSTTNSLADKGPEDDHQLGPTVKDGE